MTTVKIPAASVLAILLIVNFAVRFANGGETKKINAGAHNVAIKGYDPVAYFTKGQPMKGKPEFAHSWNGAQWRFADAKHREMFAESPEQYAPQFGGFCSMALARGKIKDIDPEAWVIVDGKLYLNFSKTVRKKFQQDVHDNIKRAQANWKDVQK